MPEKDTSVENSSYSRSVNVDIIDIMCDVKTCNPLENPIITMSRESRRNSEKCECTSEQLREVMVKKVPKIDQENIKIKAEINCKKASWSTEANIGDKVCLGATIIIVILLISVLIFYVFKDHEREK